jgi:hypothetical protein
MRISADWYDTLVSRNQASQGRSKKKTANNLHEATLLGS